MSRNFNQNNITALLAAGMMLASYPQLATGQEKSENVPNSSDRYQIEMQADGFIRLDKRTGETSFCRQVSDNLVCKMAIEERDTFHKEITSLQNQLAENQKNQKAGPDNDQAIKRPDKDVPDTRHDEFAGMDKDKFERELDTAMDITKLTVRRLFNMVKELQQELSE